MTSDQPWERGDLANGFVESSSTLVNVAIRSLYLLYLLDQPELVLDQNPLALNERDTEKCDNLQCTILRWTDKSPKLQRNIWK